MCDSKRFVDGASVGEGAEVTDCDERMLGTHDINGAAF